MSVEQMRLCDGVTLGIEGGSTNRRPVSHVARLALLIEVSEPGGARYVVRPELCDRRLNDAGSDRYNGFPCNDDLCCSSPRC
jgi:hypothetical protein